MRELKEPDGTDNREMRKFEYQDTGLPNLLCWEENSERSDQY